jgi:DNA-binding transcriptional ArsR family regulator
MALMRICAYVHTPAMDEITILQAEVLKTLANPRRLEIIHRLAQGPCEVGRLAEEIGASQPNISQHLSVLRVACSIMRGVLQRRLTRLGRLSHLDQAAAELTEIQ